MAGVFQSKDGVIPSNSKAKGWKVCRADIAFHPAPPARLFLLTGDGLLPHADDGENWLKKRDVIVSARFFGSHCWFSGRMPCGRDGPQWRLPAPRQRFGTFHRTTSGLEGTKVNALTSSRDHLFALPRGGFSVRSGWPVASYSHGLEPSHRDIMDIARHVSGHLYLLERHRGVHLLDEKNQSGGVRLFLRPSTAHAGGYKHWLRTLRIRSESWWPPSRKLAPWPHADAKRRPILERCRGFRTFSRCSRAWARGLNGPERIVFTSRPGEVYLVDWWNVWKSVDGGAQWRQLHHGLQNTVVNAIRVHPQRPQRIFLCTADNGVMASEDGGRHGRERCGC